MKDRVLLWLKRFTAVLAIILVISLLTPKQAYAYIDPGTGGMIIQGIIGLLAGALVFVGIFWKRVTLFIKSIFKRSNKADSAADEKVTLATGSKDEAVK